ncbi:MFS transporter [Bifidobacterium catenulatum]|uniref:MFS transporter n=1 Tax=Bifidobacterium catenulatum subsp. kashiwanohense TaxID=630129 RepID=A0AA43P7W6_9BIFI|nr:MFS transporter [Bifidobacterium catenulatum]MDH7890702.1 MFS transporter [Bifidobacterium catenulatum subsp. kashiwanohense]
MKLSILVAALPIPVIFFRTKPSEKGLLPLGAEMSDEEIAAAEKKSGHSLSEVNIAVGWKVLRKHAGFWLLVSGFLFVGVINGAVSVNMVSNMTSVNNNGTEVVTGGHSVVWAGHVMSLYMGVVLVAKVALGWIFDRFGITGGVLVGSCSCLLACIFLCFPTTSWGPILAAACFGVGTCTATIGPSIMISREYGRRDVGKLTGIAVSATALGGIIGAIVSGVAFDATLSFAPTWIIGAVCSVLMAVSLIASYAMSGKLVARCVAEGAPRIDAEGNIIEE